MDLRLALVTAAGPADCAIRWLDEPGAHPARYSPEMQGRVRVAPGQLVAADTADGPPTVMWRWFRGVVILRRDDYVVVDNHVYQPGSRIPFSVLQIPDALKVDVPLGAEVFYGHDPHGAVIDIVAGDTPAHPARVAADLLPAIVDIYAERRAGGA